MSKRPLQASVASDGMEISINLPPGSQMEARLRSEAARLNKEPGFLIIEIIEAALGKNAPNVLIGPLLGAQRIQRENPKIKRAEVFRQIADIIASRDK